MLKKMRSRFILAAMFAFGIVMLLLALGINVLNYYVTAARQDEMLRGIMGYEQMKTSQHEENLPMISEMPWADGPEADFPILTRDTYFSTHQFNQIFGKAKS